MHKRKTSDWIRGLVPGLKTPGAFYVYHWVDDVAINSALLPALSANAASAAKMLMVPPVPGNTCATFAEVFCTVILNPDAAVGNLTASLVPVDTEVTKLIMLVNCVALA